MTPTQRRLAYADILGAMPPAEREVWLRGFADFSKFAPLCLRVVDKGGILRPLTLSRSQLRLNRIIDRQLREQGYVRIVACKARQIWWSTLIAARFWQHCVFAPGRNAQVFAHNDKAAQNLFESFYKTYDKHYQQFGPFAKPTLISDTDQRLVYETGSRIQCFAGGNPDSVNSFRATCQHFSEFALMERGQALLENAIAALPTAPGTMAVVESSARGQGTPFHDLVQRARGGKTAWALAFFGWQDHHEYTLPLSQSVDTFQRTLTEEEIELQRTLRLTFDQLYWRRSKIDEFSGNVDKFHQEFPSNVDEAFLHSGRSYFPPTLILKAYAPSTGEQGELVTDTAQGRQMLRFRPSRGGDLCLFERPAKGELYVVGADSAEGVDPAIKTHGRSDPDYTAAQVLNSRTGHQVARLRVRATPIASARLVADLCRFFNFAYLNPESNQAGFIDGLLEDQYPQELIATRDPRADVLNGSRTIHELGWRTMSSNRGDLLAQLEAALYEGSVVLRCEQTYSEFMSFVVKANGRAEHAAGCHDDLVFSMALACHAMRRAPKVFAALARLREGQNVYGKPKPIPMTIRRAQGGDPDDRRN